jgi:hypothetical protein
VPRIKIAVQTKTTRRLTKGVVRLNGVPIAVVRIERKGAKGRRGGGGS